ncbi:MAG: DinB family protein, partial [bacterium]
MNHASIIDRLEENIPVFESLLATIPEKQVHWKPAPEKWSILEVVNHLYDEEREDFRHRLRSVLENPNEAWPPIAPEAWVGERAYSKREYAPSVSNFLFERDESIKWLRGLSSHEWQASYRHPQLGVMSAEMILANWLAHDYLH